MISQLPPIPSTQNQEVQSQPWLRNFFQTKKRRPSEHTHVSNVASPVHQHRRATAVVRREKIRPTHGSSCACLVPSPQRVHENFSCAHCCLGRLWAWLATASTGTVRCLLQMTSATPSRPCQHSRSKSKLSSKRRGLLENSSHRNGSDIRYVGPASNMAGAM